MFCREVIFVANLRTFECKIFRPQNSSAWGPRGSTILNFFFVKEVFNKEKCPIVKSPIELSLMSKLGKVCFLEGKWPCVTTFNCST